MAWNSYQLQYMDLYGTIMYYTITQPNHSKDQQYWIPLICSHCSSRGRDKSQSHRLPDEPNGSHWQSESEFIFKNVKQNESNSKKMCQLALALG